uniref:Coiled-coil domain-containing protein 181 n=1 Tax=Plectus sambesii TaxID=2011161 RepID=A0A914XBH2_9BILA
MAVVSPSTEEEQRDDDQRLPPSFPRPHHLVSPQRFAAPPSVSLLFAAEYHRSLVRREANDRLLLSPLSPSACARTTTIKFREPTVDLVVSPSSSAYSAEEEPSSLADWAELQSDSISEEEDLISADDLMDDDRTAQTSPSADADADHQDRSKPGFESAGMDVSYHEDRNANLADEPDKTVVKSKGGHESHEIDELNLGSEELSTTDTTSGENTGRDSSTGNDETGEETNDADNPAESTNDEEHEGKEESAADSGRLVADESVAADDEGDAADSGGSGNVADDWRVAAATANAQSEEIVDLEAEGNEVSEDAINNGSNDGDKTTGEIEEGDSRSQKADEDVASIEEGAAASPAPSKRSSVARASIDSARRESIASQKNEEHSIKSDEATGRSPPAQSPPVSPRQTDADGHPIGSNDGSIADDDGKAENPDHAEHAPDDRDGDGASQGAAEQTADDGDGYDAEKADLESTAEKEDAERGDDDIEEAVVDDNEKASETEEQPTEEHDGAADDSMEPAGDDASDSHQQEEQAEQADRRPSMVGADSTAAPEGDGDGAAEEAGQGGEVGAEEEAEVEESAKQQEMPDEFVLVNNDALNAAAVEEDVRGSARQEVVVPIAAEQDSPAKKKSSKMPPISNHLTNGKPPSGKKPVAMKKSQSMASNPPKSASRPPTSVPHSPKKPFQRPKSQEPPNVRREESSPARQTSRPKVDIHSIFGLSDAKREKLRGRTMHTGHSTATNELDTEKQAEKEARRADAEAAFQSWLERKRLERRRARSTGRQEDADVKESEETKQAKKQEAEAAFQAWLDRKRAAQRKEKQALLSRQVGLIDDRQRARPAIARPLFGQCPPPDALFSDASRSSIVTAALVNAD